MTFFVTGATGTIGSAVVARLVRDTDEGIVALVRDASVETARARLEAALKALDPTIAPLLAGRIRIALGDSERPRFGVDDGDYATLLERSTHIIHTAGAVRMNLPIDKARSSAVGAARNVLALARNPAASVKKIDIVSTVGVAGRDITLLPEDWVGARHAFHNTYEQAKAEAEDEIRQAVEDGLPITIHRPSMVVGDSRTGRTSQFQVFYHLVEFLSGRRTLGVFPALGQAELDLVPVDQVAGTIVRASLTPSTRGVIMHLCSGPGEAVRLVALQEYIRRAAAVAGRRLPKSRYLSRRMFGSIVAGLRCVVDARTRAALGTLPVFLDYLDTNQRFENVRTRRWLADQRMDVPRIPDYLPHVLDFYFASNPPR